jgi:hypothetical protein
MIRGRSWRAIEWEEEGERVMQRDGLDGAAKFFFFDSTPSINPVCGLHLVFKPVCALPFSFVRALGCVNSPVSVFGSMIDEVLMI